METTIFIIRPPCLNFAVYTVHMRSYMIPSRSMGSCSNACGFYLSTRVYECVGVYGLIVILWSVVKVLFPSLNSLQSFCDGMGSGEGPPPPSAVW